MADTLSSAFLQQILRSTKSPVMIVFPDGKTPKLATRTGDKKKRDELEESFQSQIKRLEATIRRLRRELREVKEEQSEQPAYTPRPPVYLMGA